MTLWSLAIYNDTLNRSDFFFQQTMTLLPYLTFYWTARVSIYITYDGCSTLTGDAYSSNTWSRPIWENLCSTCLDQYFPKVFVSLRTLHCEDTRYFLDFTWYLFLTFLVVQFNIEKYQSIIQCPILKGIRYPCFVC